MKSEAVRCHVELLQSVIQRMAKNSSSSKEWCITLVSAMLVLVANEDNPDYVLLAFIPTVLFLTLDSYYLALEKGFRNSYDIFVSKLHSDTLLVDSFYSIKPRGHFPKLFFQALLSFSVWPFYMTLILMILFVRKFVLTVDSSMLIG